MVCGTGKGRGCGPLCGGWVKVWKYLLFQAPVCPHTGVLLFQAEVHSPEGLGWALGFPLQGIVRPNSMGEWGDPDQPPEGESLQNFLESGSWSCHREV